MTTNSQLSTTEPKKQKLNKQLEQEQNHRNEGHMKCYQWESGRGRERDREGREGEKHQCLIASYVPPAGDLA